MTEAQRKYRAVVASVVADSVAPSEPRQPLPMAYGYGRVLAYRYPVTRETAAFLEFTHLGGAWWQ